MTYRDGETIALTILTTTEELFVRLDMTEEDPFAVWVTAVALGGMALHAVGASKQKPLMCWLVRCFQVAAEHGTRFHGFGMTSAQLVRNLPFYSVDSSSYTLGIRWGLAYLWNADALRMESVLFRNADEVRPHADLFRAHGLDPAAVVRPPSCAPAPPRSPSSGSASARPGPARTR